jgi:hypothetical protein
VFRYDGENSDVKGVPTAGRTYAARVSGSRFDTCRFCRRSGTYLGVAFCEKNVPKARTRQHGAISSFTCSTTSM